MSASWLSDYLRPVESSLYPLGGVSVLGDGLGSQAGKAAPPSLGQFYDPRAPESTQPGKAYLGPTGQMMWAIMQALGQITPRQPGSGGSSAWQ